jgi:hypothetical protein
VVEAVTGTRPQGSSTTQVAHVAAPVAETVGVQRVAGAGAGGWSSAGTLLPILVDGSTVIAGIASVEVLAGAAPDDPLDDTFEGTDTRPEAVDGRLVAVADATLFDNAHLPEADNAAFAIAVVGEAGRPVVFSEGQHGYQGGDGLAAIPNDWRWFLAGAALAALVWMLARSRRVGEPDRPSRMLPPPRSDYVEALAAGLARRREPASITAALQTRCRSRVARRVGLAPSAPVESIRAAAEGLGLDSDEVEAMTAGDGSPVDLVAVGRAHARLHRGNRSTDAVDRGPS